MHFSLKKMKSFRPEAVVLLSLTILAVSLQGSNALGSEEQLLTKEGSGVVATTPSNITVELVSNRAFDPEKNASNLKIVRDTVDDYSRSEGIRYPSANIRQSIVDHGGKFAVLFRIEDDEEDVRCDEVRRFVRGAKRHSKELAYAVLRCDGEKTQVL